MAKRRNKKSSKKGSEKSASDVKEASKDLLVEKNVADQREHKNESTLDDGAVDDSMSENENNDEIQSDDEDEEHEGEKVEKRDVDDNDSDDGDDDNDDDDDDDQKCDDYITNDNVDEEEQEKGENGIDFSSKSKSKESERVGSVAKGSERSEFLDAFYELASMDPRERSRAGQVIIYQSLLSPQKSNVADAAYALKRLLNGLCSGRAAARQGSASALALFLKVAKAHGYLTKIQQQQELEKHEKESKEESLGVLSYVQSRLLQASCIVDDDREGKGSQGGRGRKKAAEIKDHKLGQLFGILAIVRSGILLPAADSQTEVGNGNISIMDETTKKDSQETAQALVSDLHELYSYKPFLREPAAHAACTLLNSFCLVGSRNNQKLATKAASHLVEHRIIPLFLHKGDSTETIEGTGSELTLNSFSAEQIAISLTIQSFGDAISTKAYKKLGPLKDPILAISTLPALADTLVNTCAVDSPRMHVLWDALWLYLTEPLSADRDKAAEHNNSHGDNKATSPVDTRILRSKLPLVAGKNSSTITARNLMETILEEVVVKRLLAVGENEGDDDPTQPSKLHFRGCKAMALSLIQIMSGVEFVSSLSGRTVLALEAEEFVFQERIVRKLFMDLLVGNSGATPGKKRKTNHGSLHQLKTLTLACLNNIVESVSTPTTIDADKHERRRLAILKCIVRCDARFDSQTRTTVIQDLLGLNVEDVKELPMHLWKEFIAFAQHRILMAKDHDDDAEMEEQVERHVTSYEALGLIDLLFRLSKQIIRIEAPSDLSTDASISLRDFKESSMRQILSYLAIASFVRPMGETTTRNVSTDSAKVESQSLELARRALRANIPLDTRKSLQARLFSLMTEVVMVSSGAVRNAPKSSTSSIREIAMLRPLLYISEECKKLQLCGFIDKSMNQQDDDHDDDDDDDDSKDNQISTAITPSIFDQADAKSDVAADSSPRNRFMATMGMLKSFLELCVLSSQDPDTELGEMSNLANVNDSDEIWAMLEEASDCSDAVLDETHAPDSDALSRLVAICLNLISWEPDESKGTSKRLIREIVKLLLNSGMMIIAKSSSPDPPHIDRKVALMMMEGVGVVSTNHEEGQEVENPDDDDDDDDDDDHRESDHDSQSEELEVNGLFTKSAALMVTDGDGEDEDVLKDDDDADSDEGIDETKYKNQGTDDEEIVIDDDRLNSLLEEDSDMDVDDAELEHHEGADAALALLIKRKQEARKAGQVARERVELSQQLRCVLVLETVINGKPESWGRILRCDVLMTMIPLVLGRISQLEKAQNAYKAKGSPDPIANEREALLKALTNFYKSKLLKSKMWNMGWTESVLPEEHCHKVIQELMALCQSNAASKEQKKICFQALPTLLRCLPSYDSRVEIGGKIYKSAIEEWSTKKSTRITSHMFEELIHRDSPLAQNLLVKPLCDAIPKARSRFLKSECFRLLAEIYNPNINKASTEQEKQALDVLVECKKDFLRGAASALMDAEMLKMKGIKEIVRTIEKVVAFKLLNESQPPTLPSPLIEKLENALQFASKTTESANAKQLCESLLRR
ncbi:hypothetical protein ACA910_009899 [Epithemia clementina (nom. ined.)]